MSEISIRGGKPLNGEVFVQGSKNAVLPILAASLLVTEGRTILTNAPDISDVECLNYLLSELGCLVNCKENRIEIDAAPAAYVDLDKEMVGRTRASVLMLGALIGRFKQAVIAYPGGCTIGERPVNLHVNALRKLGVKVLEEADMVFCRADSLQGSEIHLAFPSVGATENVLLSSVLAEGVTTLYNAAKEPEIHTLIEFLNGAGADITIGEPGVVRIRGVKKLVGFEYKLPPDRIVGGTYLIAVAAAGGHARIHNVIEEEQRVLINALRACGCEIEIKGNLCEIKSNGNLKAVSLVTEPYPGFPTDLQPQMLAALTKTKGFSTIRENIFEARFHICTELSKMGANVVMTSQMVTVEGVLALTGSSVKAQDLRGGAALCIAGLMAEGVTRIFGISYIQRGYEDICRDLRMLGADISCIKSEESF